MLPDFILREEAEARMEQQDDSENRTQGQMMQEFGITRSELDAIDSGITKSFLSELID